MENQILPGANGQAIGYLGLRKGDPGHDEWFLESTNQLRQRTAREGSWVEQPTRQTVGRLIDWLEDGMNRVN
jgi:hypothetical protein